jgi:hypothetical protein
LWEENHDDDDEAEKDKGEGTKIGRRVEKTRQAAANE